MTTDLSGVSPYAELASIDPVLARLVEAVGEPEPFEFPDAGRTAHSPFSGMVLHILSQQISVKVALVVYDRLVAAVGGSLMPEHVLRLDPAQLRGLGTSNAKASYILDLAARVHDGALDFAALAELSDVDAIGALTEVKGVGPWSAHMFLIHQLERPDILPSGDLGIRIAVQRAFSLGDRPTIAEVERLGTTWSPYRTYAAALLWGLLRVPEPA